MKKLAALLLSLLMLLTAVSALAEDGLYLRQLPQYTYSSDTLLTPESYPEVRLNPNSAYKFFTDYSPAEPVFVCFPGPGGDALVNDFDVDSVTYLDPTNAIQYNYTVHSSASWEEFVKKMNYCMMKQFAALEKGGRMFVLVGDMKRRGKLYSMIRELICPGTMENIIIKAQHNCWSDRQSYSNQNFVPIVHEYLLVIRKDAGLIVPVSFGKSQNYDMRSFGDQSWRDLVFSVIEENGGQMSLQELYDALKDSSKAKRNPHWQEKIRQTVQNIKHFVRTERGCYALTA